MAVRMELARILIRELNDYQVIELREVAPVQDDDARENGSTGSSTGQVTYSQVENGRSFPIVIGLPEAQAIERRLKGIGVKRPQTHDLLVNVMEALGGRLESICIHDLTEHTFFAELRIRNSKGELLKVDARPSDAIALGIASNVPLFVEEKVLNEAQREEPE
ncbi:MAG: bifunctional nuclease family protein [Phycisphaeraceae bacterium]|nr:bifunctional nuclease family protein [Phycisphaeraceae bacterium]